MRTLKTTVLLLLMFLLMAPAPAQAWWGWLEELSGPGRFWGAEFDFRLACLMQQAPWTEAIADTQVALGLLSSLQSAPAPPVDYGKLYADLGGIARPPLRELGAPPGGSRKDELAESRLQREIGTRQGAINLAGEIQPWVDTLRERLRAADMTSAGGTQANRLTAADRVNLQAVHDALARAASSLRASAVQRVSKFPGSVAWANCADRSFGDTLGIRHQDRHEVLSVVLNYREYWNSDYSNWGHATNDTYAGGEIIHLRIIEPKISWPMSGRLDVLDGQAGIGLYSFSSKGMSGTLVGMIVEPIRFDLHFPSKLADSQRNFFARLPLALSFRAGVVLFPAGFAPDAFNAKATAARRITGGEALFEYGIVVNVGRLIQ